MRSRAPVLFPRVRTVLKVGKVPFLPPFLPSSLPHLNLESLTLNLMVSSRPVGGGTTDRDRPNERASDGCSDGRRTAAAPENGILNFSPFLRLMPSSSAPSVEKNLNQQKEGEGHDRRRWREGKNGIVSHRRISVMYSSLGKESFNPY